MHCLVHYHITSPRGGVQFGPRDAGWIVFVGTKSDGRVINIFNSGVRIQQKMRHIYVNTWSKFVKVGCQMKQKDHKSKHYSCFCDKSLSWTNRHNIYMETLTTLHFDWVHVCLSSSSSWWVSHSHHQTHTTCLCMAQHRSTCNDKHTIIATQQPVK